MKKKPEEKKTKHAASRINLKTEFLAFTAVSMMVLVILMGLFIWGFVKNSNSEIKRVTLENTSAFLRVLSDLLDEDSNLTHKKSGIGKLFYNFCPSEGCALIIKDNETNKVVYTTLGADSSTDFGNDLIVRIRDGEIIFDKKINETTTMDISSQNKFLMEMKKSFLLPVNITEKKPSKVDLRKLRTDIGKSVINVNNQHEMDKINLALSEVNNPMFQNISKKYTTYLIGNRSKQADGRQIILQLQVMILIALLGSFLLAWLLSNTVSAPINVLIKGTKQFADGNFSYRLKNSRYIEINNLIRSYNSMAQNLQTLYLSLEQKVKDRTAELEVTLKELKSTQAMMVHSEKMKSLGGLVAGITHEINNPVNFIYGNLIHLSNYSNDLISLISKYTEYEKNLSIFDLAEIEKIKKDIDYDFLQSDLPELIKSCKEGTERTKNIIADLKNFSRLDENVISSVNLPKEIDTTLNILSNKLKNKVNVHKEYAQNLPQITANGGQLNQVFMNILDNAAYAIKEKGDIYIRLNYDKKYALIEFEDNGCGMDTDMMKKIFDPFYTTKPVGQGTGLGMSISYKVIKNHGGDIKISSEKGKGTKFEIKLPIEFENSSKEQVSKNG